LQIQITTAVDGAGNVYFSSANPADVSEISSSVPPVLNFATTPYGATSTPQAVTMANIGNAALSFPLPSAGSNPSIATNFTLNSSGASACPLVNAGSGTAATLAANSSCQLLISFVPTTLGALSGSLVLTDNNLNAAAPRYATQSIALSGMVTQATPTITVAASANPAFVSNPVTFTATVSAPTGTVSFYDGQTLLGSATLAAGVATYASPGLAAGPHSITAVYSGDGNFLTATSTVLTETIEDFTLGSSSGGTTSATASPGGLAVYTFAIDPPSGTTFAGAITFTVAGLPTGATATFSPATIPAGAGATNVTMTVTLPSQTAALPNYSPLGGIALGLILLPFASRLRRSARPINKMASLLIVVLASVALAAALTGCGGSSSSTSSPAPQSYTLTVTATTGSLSHTTIVSLMVD
jgi:hypothetical protein